MAEGRRYRVIGVLGRGGFGTVYRADLLGEGSFVRPVALKVLNPDMEGVAHVAARLRDEARLLGRVRHRAIVQVDGLVRLDDRWTVVMEYVDGVDLGRVVEAGRVPPRAALEIVGEVAGALHVVQTWPGDDGRPLGLLHRDVKPANLLLTAAGEVKVLDFGVARADAAPREAHTRGMRFGSPGYVAPERLDGEERAEGDVYSLGVVAYELLAGRVLGKGSGRQDRHEATRNEAFTHLPPLDPEVLDLLVAMTSWEPDDRPSAREVERRCRALSARLDGEFLRDWAEVVVPPLLASRTLGDARTEFSAEIVSERVSGSLPGSLDAAPERAHDTLAMTFDQLDLGDLRPPAKLAPPTTLGAPPKPPAPEVEVPAPPAVAPPPRPAARSAAPAPPRRPRRSTLGRDLGFLFTVFLAVILAVFGLWGLGCFAWLLLIPFMTPYGY